MAKRRTIGKNPLDDLVSETPAPATASEPGATPAEVFPNPISAGGKAAGQGPAKALEQRRRMTNESNLQTQYLTFHLAGEEYAAGILQVKEIIEYDEITMVPKTPPSIRGVINLRGSVVPVVDLAVKFNLPATGVTNRTCIIIVEVDLDGERTVMGLMTDAVSQVIELKAGDIKAPPTMGEGVSVDYLLGMGKAGKKFILILDIDKVLSAEKLLGAAAALEDEGRFIQEDGVLPQGEEAGLL
jgi:purine-binding chemotaxis protein CheW